MYTSADIKKVVKQKYGEVVEKQKKTKAASCCDPGCCGDSDVDLVVDYSQLQGYNPDADYGLGCGLPTKFANIKAGDTVLDLGSGAGNDCFVARSVVGESGKVIGVDMTEKMIAKAKANAEKSGYKNIEFRLGEIENLPVADNSVDVVLSNCVINLVPDKDRAFAETYRVLKPGGHISISDIVLEGELPEAVKHDADIYVSCVAGALQKSDYLNKIAAAGFKNITVQDQVGGDVSDEQLKSVLSEKQIKQFKKNPVKVFSITVYAEKP